MAASTSKLANSINPLTRHTTHKHTGNHLDLQGIIHRFRTALEEQGIHCQEVLLYGSHRWGRAEEGSDIDLIVVSSDWTPYLWRERLEILGITAASILEPIQAQGFTPDEIHQQTIGSFWQGILVNEAVAVNEV